LFLSLLYIIHTSPPWLLLTLHEQSFVSRFDTKKSREIFQVPDCHLTPLIWWNDQKWNITKFLNILIQSNLFKRSNFPVISQFIHVKDISKVNDNGNQYKQKLILWYWTKNYFFNGLHSFENIFLLRNNLNVLKFKGNH
jgi:hypothetical protein